MAQIQNISLLKVLKRYLGVFAFTLVSVGCATGNHGTFSESTFFDRNNYTNYRKLGPVTGESCQTLILYVLPHGAPPSTMEALENAMTQYKDTVFLSNVSIETRQEWLIGYSNVCTIVTGTAYTAEPVAKEIGGR